MTDVRGSQQSMAYFSSNEHSKDVSTSIDNLTLPITGSSDITPDNSQYNNQVSSRYAEFFDMNQAKLKVIVCDKYKDNDSVRHEVQKVIFLPENPDAPPKNRKYITVDNKIVPYAFRDVLIDRNMGTNEITFLTPTSLQYNFSVNNEETRGRKLSPSDYFEYYDGVIFRLFYSKSYNGWNVATNYLANGDKFVVNSIFLGRKFKDVFTQTVGIDMMLDINSIYYFVFSHPYATYDPEAKKPRVIFLARQLRSNGNIVDSPAFDGRRVQATDKSSMMFNIDSKFNTIQVVQRTVKYSKVNQYAKQHIRASKSTNHKNLNNESVNTANPFLDFGQRLLTTMPQEEIDEADTNFFNYVPRYRSQLFDVFFKPLKVDIENVEYMLKEWIRMCWYSTESESYPELTRLMYIVLQNGLHLYDPSTDIIVDIENAIRQFDDDTINDLCDKDTMVFREYMITMQYSLLINLFIEFYGTFMPNCIDFFQSRGYDTAVFTDIYLAGKKYLDKAKTTNKRKGTTTKMNTTSKQTVTQNRDMWA